MPKTDGVTEDDVLLAVLDAGAEEVNDLDESFEIVSEATDLVAVLGEDNGRIIAVRHGVLLATAFHPELTPDLRIHKLFVSMVKGTS